MKDKDFQKNEQSAPARQGAYPQKDTPHICRNNLGPRCVCTVCGTICHTMENDSNGSGTGRVDAWCTVCGAKEAYYDDTGGTIFSYLWPEGYDYREHKEWTKTDYDRAMAGKNEEAT